MAMMKIESADHKQRRLKNLNEYRKSIKDMLMEQKWDLYLTITFRNPAYQDTAKKRVFDFFEHLNQPLDIFYVNFIKGFFVFEKFKEHDDVHVHALIRRIPPQLDSELQSRCNARFGKSEVCAYNPALAVECCSYMADSCCPDENNWMPRTINSHYRWDPKLTHLEAGSRAEYFS